MIYLIFFVYFCKVFATCAFGLYLLETTKTALPYVIQNDSILVIISADNVVRRRSVVPQPAI